MNRAVIFWDPKEREYSYTLLPLPEGAKFVKAIPFQAGTFEAEFAAAQAAAEEVHNLNLARSETVEITRTAAMSAATALRPAATQAVRRARKLVARLTLGYIT